MTLEQLAETLRGKIGADDVKFEYRDAGHRAYCAARYSDERWSVVRLKGRLESFEHMAPAKQTALIAKLAAIL